VSDRLSAADVAFLYLESPATPQHVGGLAVFTAPSGFDYDRLVRLIDERIALAPRYRQKLREVPCNLANPVWVDDADFDLNYHVRRSALPRPGTEVELLEFCGRIQSRALDRSRPLWEMYLVEGLSGGRVAIVTKTHPSMVDGTGTDRGIDITEVLLDESPEPRRTVSTPWRPRREPSSLRLVADAACGVLRSPRALVDTVRLSMRETRSTTDWLTGSVVGLGDALVGAVTRSNRTSRHSPLRAELGQHRRIAIARADLEQFRQIRAWRSGNVHDAILTVVTGALRGWLSARGEPLAPTTTVRAMVPVGVHGADRAGWTRSSRVAALLVDLPVGEPDPVRRLTRVQFAMAAHSSSEPIGADALVGLSGFAPPTLHSLSARAAHGLTRRMYDIAVTNVPGPQLPLYAAGAQLAEMFPIMPLTDGHALSIGLTSYDGRVCFGVNADRDAVPDVDEVAQLLRTALAELVAACRPADIEPGRRRRRREPQP
jgi:WS/DGAT/MGAT family acyltransferase